MRSPEPVAADGETDGRHHRSRTTAAGIQDGTARQGRRTATRSRRWLHRETTDFDAASSASSRTKTLANEDPNSKLLEPQNLLRLRADASAPYTFTNTRCVRQAPWTRSTGPGYAGRRRRWTTIYSANARNMASPRPLALSVGAHRARHRPGTPPRSIIAGGPASAVQSASAPGGHPPGPGPIGSVILNRRDLRGSAAGAGLALDDQCKGRSAGADRHRNGGGTSGIAAGGRLSNANCATIRCSA